MAEEKILQEEFNEFNDEFKYSVIEEGTDASTKKYKIRGCVSKAGVKNKNGRIYPKSVMEESVKEAQDAISQARFVGELEHPSCVLDDGLTILTSNGWKPFDTVDASVDKLLTLDENGNFEENSIEDKISTLYSGEAYHFLGRNIDVTVTPNHRFLLLTRYNKYEYADAETIFNNRTKYNHSRIVKTGNWSGNGKTEFVISGTEKVPEDLVLDAKVFFGFMGIYLSEGHYLKKANGVCITQKNPENVIKIRELIEVLGLPFRENVSKKGVSVFTVSDNRLHEFVAKLGDCYAKYIPEEMKEYDACYLEELVEWFIIGDGRDRRSKKESKYCNLFSTSKRLVEDLHECLIKCGGSGNWREIEPGDKEYVFAEHVIKPENKHTLYQLNVSTTGGIYLDERFLTVEKVFVENKYAKCFTVKNSNFYMKVNDKAYFTGNSPKINIERISHKITNLQMMEDGTVVGEMEILTEMPCGKILKTLIDSGVGLAVSTRGTGSVKRSKISHDGITEDVLEVQPGFKLRAIDVVFDPSAGEFGSPKFIAEGAEFDTKPSKKVVFGDVWKQLFM